MFTEIRWDPHFLNTFAVECGLFKSLHFFPGYNLEIKKHKIYIDLNSLISIFAQDVDEFIRSHLGEQHLALSTVIPLSIIYGSKHCW